jgi:hypothetical protein
MTVLLVGAVYWVWTQIQYVQRKVNVLDNIVYELKTLCSSKQPPEVYLGGPTSPTPPTPSQYPPAPSSVLDEDEDLLHETLHAEEQKERIVEYSEPEIEEEIVAEVVQESPEVSKLPEIQSEGLPAFQDEDVGSIDLQPGGVGSGVKSVSLSSSLDSMTLKELRRLGKQKGIANADDLRKKELITALRASSIDSFLEAQ